MTKAQAKILNDLQSDGSVLRIPQDGRGPAIMCMPNSGFTFYVQRRVALKVVSSGLLEKLPDDGHRRDSYVAKR